MPKSLSVSNIVLAPVFALVLALLAACGPGEVGEQCGTADDCVDGLTCVSTGGLRVGEGTPECVFRQICSIPCARDSDCAAAGTGLMCLDGCGAGPAVCVARWPD